MYKHILLATDFSHNALHTAQTAANLATLFHADLSMIHVIEHVPHYAYVYENIEHLQDYLIDQAKQKMQALADKLAVTTKLQLIEIGHASDVIFATIKSLNIDLVVINSHRHGRLSHLLGSKATSIANHAPCDTYIVKDID